MNYDDVIKLLNAAHFYPSIEVRVKNKSKVTEGLRVDSPPILKDDREKRLKEIVGDEFTVDWLGNDNNYFLIKKK